MTELAFDCISVKPQPYAAAPTLAFRLRIAETTGEPLHNIALRCQLRIQPRQRRYSREEEERLLDLFGEATRWSETLKPLQFANTSTLVPPFTGSVEVDLPVECTYDLEVAAAKYFHSLGDGNVPILLLFSGTVFRRTSTGFAVEPVPWHKEASYDLPVAVWRQMMDLYFPGSAWLRLRRETVDALRSFTARQAIATWDDAITTLLDAAGEAKA